jgi:hypothetical protein
MYRTDHWRYILLELLGGICIEQIIGDTFVIALFCDRGIEQSLWHSTVIMELFEHVSELK